MRKFFGISTLEYGLSVESLYTLELSLKWVKYTSLLIRAYNLDLLIYYWEKYTLYIPYNKFT